MTKVSAFIDLTKPRGPSITFCCLRAIPKALAISSLLSATETETPGGGGPAPLSLMRLPAVDNDTLMPATSMAFFNWMANG